MPVHPWVRGNWGGCLSNCLLEVRLEAVRSGLDRGGCQGGRGCVGVVDAAGAAGPGRQGLNWGGRGGRSDRGWVGAAVCNRGGHCLTEGACEEAPQSGRAVDCRGVEGGGYRGENNKKSGIGGR